jgi:hypothetical protein
MDKRIILGLIILMMVSISSATLLTSGTVATKAVTFGSGIRFSHDFQVYDRISGKYFNITDQDIMEANAWVDETGGLPLISSPYSGKAYYLPQEFTVSEDYLECIPLTGMVAIEPSGYVELPSNSGNKFWSTAYGPAAGVDGMDEYTYMYNEGWNPAILWQLMGGQEDGK